MKIRHLRWYIAALLFTSTVINYIDRQTLSIVAPLLTKELELLAIQYSNVLTGFHGRVHADVSWLGAFRRSLGNAALAERLHAWWSLSNMLHALANSALQLGVFRVLLGAGESGNFMAAIKVVSEWYPAKERAFVNGLIQAGAAVGAIIATPLVTFLAL